VENVTGLISKIVKIRGKDEVLPSLQRLS